MRVDILILIGELKVLKKECALIFEHSHTRVGCYIAFNLTRCY